MAEYGKTICCCMIVNDDNVDDVCGNCHLTFGVALGVKEPTHTPPPVHEKKKEPVVKEPVEPKKKEPPVHHEVKPEDPEKDVQKKAVGRPKKEDLHETSKG